MRWNCPHCEALVTAGIDFEATKKAYVRCAKCGGMALIHRSAALADYVKARRLEEEAQLEAEILIANAAREKAKTMEMTAPPTLAPPTATASTTGLDMIASATSEMMIVPAATAIPATAIPATATTVEYEPNGFDPVVETSGIYETTEITEGEGATAASLPVFEYAAPPAFLVSPLPVETLPPLGDTPFDEPILTATEAKGKASWKSNAPIWIAAMLALASGVFLLIEGHRSF